MGESKHTPGPWRIPHFALPSANCDCEYIFSDGMDRMGAVASVHYSAETHKHDLDNPPLEEAIANASLICAAPDLLAACESLLEVAGYDYMSDDELRHEHEAGNQGIPPIIMARAAILKAKGPTP